MVTNLVARAYLSCSRRLSCSSAYSFDVQYSAPLSCASQYRSAVYSIASRSQRVSLIVIPFCLSVCLSVIPRPTAYTMIDRSQPNLVGTYIPVLGPV